MLFVALLSFKPGLTREQSNSAAQRRSRWKPPAGITPVAEYWLQGSAYVVSVFETQSATSILATFTPWNDVFDIQVFPAVSADDGLRVLQEAGIIRRRGRPPKPRPELTGYVAPPASPRRRAGRPRRRAAQGGNSGGAAVAEPPSPSA